MSYINHLILDLVADQPSNVNNREMTDRNSKKSHYIRSKEESCLKKNRFISQVYFVRL